ncbi:MAG: CinA family protein [Chloroflexota bacterium]
MTIPAWEELIALPLKTTGWSLSLAESCTGGLVSHRVTNIPGSSDYYLGGVNAYTNEIKIRLLGVLPETLATDGAVSEQTVREMALGAQRVFQSDVALSISGIAGPGGGSPQKPVGTVWIGLAVRSDLSATKFHFHGDRVSIKNQSAEMALWLLYQALLDHIHVDQKEITSFLYHPITVNFSFTPASTPKIQSFVWQGKGHTVESHGRQWDDTLGRHFLVMDIRQKVYELIWTSSGCWYLHARTEIPHA